jgi:hypothetical protein
MQTQSTFFLKMNIQRASMAPTIGAETVAAAHNPRLKWVNRAIAIQSQNRPLSALVQ